MTTKLIKSNEVDQKKMFKTKHGWMIGSSLMLAGGIGALATVNEVHADTINNATATKATTNVPTAKDVSEGKTQLNQTSQASQTSVVPKQTATSQATDKTVAASASPQLSQAVNNASQAGVKVSSGAPVTVANQSEATQNIASQVANINKVTSTANSAATSYKAAQTSYATAKSAYQQDSQANASMAASYAAAQKSVAAANSQAQASYATAMNSYNTAASQTTAYNSEQAVKESQAQASYATAMSQYNQEEQAFQKELQQYNQSGFNNSPFAKQNANDNPNGITSNSVKNYLTMGAEPDAVTTISNVNSDWTEKTEPIAANMKNQFKLDSPQQLVFTEKNKDNQGFNTPVATVTFSNLKNTFYENQHISKIVETYSIDYDNGGSSTTSFDVYSDPSEGLYTNNLHQINVSYKFYNANGDLITFDKDHPAYITITSLNDWWAGKNDNGGVDTTHPGETFQGPNGTIAAHVEYAEAVNDTTPLAFKGSPVGVHDGKYLYSDTSNGNTITGADGKQVFWDTSHSPLQYLGSGVMEITGNNPVIGYGVSSSAEVNETGKGSGLWATATTTIVPTAPIQPTKPTPSDYAPKNMPTKPTAPSAIPMPGTPDYKKLTNPTAPVAPSAQSVEYHDVNVEEHTITIHYVDQNGNEIPGYPTKTITGTEGSPYTSSEQNIPNYHYNDETGMPSNGTIPDKDGDVYYHYDQPASITVHYVDQDGNEIPNVPVQTINGENGDKYTTAPKDIPGYHYNDETGLPENGTLPLKGGEVIYHYDQQAPVTVHYVDQNGNEIPGYPVIKTTGNVGSPYTTQEKNIPGYKYVNETGDAPQGTISKNGDNIIYHYDQEGTVNVHYVDQNGNPIAPETSETGETGSPYTTEPKNIPGYHLVKETGAPADGKYTNGTQDVVYHYVKNAPVQTPVQPQIGGTPAPQAQVVQAPVQKKVVEKVVPQPVQVTTTKEVVQPVQIGGTPVPQQPVVQAPQVQQPKLPQTGDSNEVVGAMVLATVGIGLGLVGTDLKKKEN